MRNDKLLLELIEQESKAENGLVYTESQGHKSFRGRVFATCEECGYEVGDVVLFSEFAGEKTSLDNKEYTIIDSTNVFAVEVIDDSTDK